MIRRCGWAVLEKLGYLWLEEPLPDENFAARAKLTRNAGYPVGWGRVLAKHPGRCEVVANPGVDAVRADVSWSGGVTGVMRTAHLADAFHMPCEIHSAIFHPLELMNLHVAAALPNTGRFECCGRWTALPSGSGRPARGGRDGASAGRPRLGMDLDWDMIEGRRLPDSDPRLILLSPTATRCWSLAAPSRRAR